MSSSKKSLIFSIVALAVVYLVMVSLKNNDNVTPPVESMAPIKAKGPQIQTWFTDNGAKVLFVPTLQLPMVDIRVIFDAGSARDENKPGLALLTNTMLQQGAAEWNSDDIAERFDSIGARFSSTSMRDMSMFNLRSLTDDEILQQSLDTFSAILQKPTFPEKDFERERQQILIALKNQQQSPADILSRLFYQNLFPEHPYGSPEMGTEDSISAMTIDEIKAFYKQYIVAKNALIVMVGKLELDQATEIANKLSSGLTAGSAATALPEPRDLDAAKVIEQQYPSTQTHIQLGLVGLKRGDEDYYSLYVGNHILGGSGFSSRIVQQIREDRGLAYSSYSYFIPMHVKGPFLIGMQTKNDQTDEALVVLKQTLTKFITEGPTSKELEHSKQNITGGFPLRIASNKKIIEYLGVIGFYDLPLDYLDTFNKNIDAVSIENIKDAFNRRVNPDKMLTVIVGDRKFTKKQIDDIKHGSLNK